MKKIPTIFERDFEGGRAGRVQITPLPNIACAWVFAGEGVATQKLDGTCCLIRDGRLFKRRELRAGERAPADFEQADFDEKTGKTVGWVPVGDGPEDRWHRGALERDEAHYDGTYELVGPKVQGNPEGSLSHALVAHRLLMFVEDVPRDFNGLRDWLATRDIEGIVWHHPDGRMAKIKKRDFGLQRKPIEEPT